MRLVNGAVLWLRWLGAELEAVFRSFIEWFADGCPQRSW